MRFPEDVPVLTDGVVTLRAHTPADIDGAYEMCSDPEFQRWTTVPVPYQRSHAESFLTERIPAGWRDGGYWAWAIEVDGRFAGTIDLRDGDGGAGDIGFGTAPWARGRGVTTRAARLVVRHGLEGFGWTSVTWRAFAGNWGSRRVAWKSGFRGFSTVRGGGVSRGVRHDEWIATIAVGEELEPQGSWLTVPVLENERIRLRPVRDADAPRIAEACADERTQHWLSRMPSPYTLADARVFIGGRAEAAAAGTGVTWVAADPATDELLANVSLFGMNDRIDPTAAEVGYWAHPAARGRGVVSEGVRLVIEHAFAPATDGGLGRRRLYLIAAAGNTASQQVAKRCGFTHVGTSRSADPRRDGSYDDQLTFDLLETDTPG